MKVIINLKSNNDSLRFAIISIPIEVLPFALIVLFSLY